MKISIGPYGGKVEGFGFDVKFDNGGPVVFVVVFPSRVTWVLRNAPPISRVSLPL